MNVFTSQHHLHCSVSVSFVATLVVRQLFLLLTWFEMKTATSPALFYQPSTATSAVSRVTLPTIATYQTTRPPNLVHHQPAPSVSLAVAVAAPATTATNSRFDTDKLSVGDLNPPSFFSWQKKTKTVQSLVNHQCAFFPSSVAHLTFFF